MKSGRVSTWFLFIGILVSLISFCLAFLKINNWHFPAVIGVWFIFDYIASLKYNTTLSIFFNNKKKFFQLYLVMLFLGCSIEGIGRFILNYWNYPFGNYIGYEFLLILFYPFILFSFREMYQSIKIASDKFAFIISLILGIIIWEGPNMISRDWVYTVPLSSIKLLNLELIVIIGWLPMLWLVLFLYKSLEIK